MEKFPESFSEPEVPELEKSNKKSGKIGNWLKKNAGIAMAVTAGFAGTMDADAAPKQKETKDQKPKLEQKVEVKEESNTKWSSDFLIRAKKDIREAMVADAQGSTDFDKQIRDFLTIIKSYHVELKMPEKERNYSPEEEQLIKKNAAEIAKLIPDFSDLVEKAIKGNILKRESAEKRLEEIKKTGVDPVEYGSKASEFQNMLISQENRLQKEWEKILVEIEGFGKRLTQ